MVKPASFDKNGMKSGAWSEEEDNKLRAYISRFGHPNWRLLPLVAGLKRNGKSCRLRWVNYLKPGLRRGKFTKDEELLIIELHNQLGNKWSAITAYFPGRTDNDIKNYWHAHIQKRSGGASRSIRMRNPAPEYCSSDSINSSITTTGLDQDIPPTASEVAFNQAAENIGAFESNAYSDYNDNAALYQACFTNNFDNFDDHSFVEQEFDGVGEHIFSTLGDIDSSDWGIANWNNLSDATLLTQQDFLSTEPVGQDIFNNQFWR